jgi:hypothetical protein
MPIVPRADLPQGVPLSPRYATGPIDNTLPSIMEHVTQAGLAVSGVATTLAANKARVENTTEMAKRTMMIETQLAGLQDDIRSNRDLHKDAVSQYDEAVKGMSEGWTKDLRPDLQAILNEHAARKVIAGRKVMGEIQNKYLIDDAANTTDNYERVKIDNAGRLDMSDEQAFEGVAQTRVPIYVTEQPSSVAVKSEYRQGLDAYVASGAMTADKAGDRERNLLDAMAYRRIQRMAISDNPGVVKQALDTLDADEQSPGSSIARFLKTEHKNVLRQAAQGQRDKLEQQAITNANQAYAVYERQKKETDAEQKKRDSVEINDLSLGILRGEKGLEDLNKVLVANPTLQEDRATSEHLQDLIDKRGRAGGVTNWTLYNQFRDEIVRTRGAANITSRLLAVTSKPGGIAWDDADKLMTMSTTQGERSVFKDDFFQAGQKDLDRSLMPAIGVVDDAKQRRHAEASREFFDRASTYVQSGEREKIPQLAREISDRYIKQAPNLTVIAPRNVPRYPDAQSLTGAYVQQYGSDRSKWSPAANAEYNRQSRILQDMQPSPGVVPPQTPPGPKPKQPNPIAK